MKTLAANVTANVMKQGARPRYFVRIPDADLFLATKPLTDSGEVYVDRIANLSEINVSCEPYGGLATVGGVEIENLYCEDRITLCDEAICTTARESYGGTNYRGAARLLSQGTPLQAYTDVRNATTGDFNEVALVVGRVFNPVETSYSVYRSILQYVIPSALTTCEDAFLEFTGAGLYSSGAFNIGIINGTWPNFSNPTGMLNDFTGWQAAGDYTSYITLLNETWGTGEYVADPETGIVTCRIRLNLAGRTLIEGGGIIQFVLISQNDYSNAAAPTGQEYIQFMNAPFLKLRYNAVTLDNQPVELYLAYDPVPASHANMELLWKGVIDNYTITDTTLSLKCVPNQFKKDVMLPGKIITLTDWPLCPEWNVGKSYPLVYGQFAATLKHLTGVGNFYGDDLTGIGLFPYSYPDCFQTLLVKEDELNRAVIFSNQPMKSAAKPEYKWNSSIKAYELYPVYTGAISSSWSSSLRTYRNYSNVTSLINFPSSLCEQHFAGLSSVIPYKNKSTAITNPSSAYDSDSATYAIMTGATSELILYFNQPDGTTGNSSCTFIVYLEFIGGADPTKSHLILEKNESTDTITPSWVEIINETLWTASGQQQYGFFLIDGSGNRQSIQLSQFRMKINRSDSTGTVRISDAFSIFAYDSDKEKELYSYGDGNYYGTWIDAAGRTNSYNANDLIENPIGVVESIARDEMGFTTANINTTDFDTASTTLSAWEFAFQILERKKASDYLHDLLIQCRSKGFYDNQDMLTVRPFSATKGFANSNTDIPGALDIFDYTGAPSGDLFTHNAMIDAPIITRQNMDEVMNDFALHYRLNYATNEHTEVLTCGALATNVIDANLEDGQTAAALIALCSDSLALINTTNTDEYEAWAIRDLATASKLLQYRVERMTKRRYQLEFTATDSAVRFEPGDFVNVRCDRLYDLFGDAVTEIKKWEILELNYNANDSTVRIKLIEV